VLTVDSSAQKRGLPPHLLHNLHLLSVSLRLYLTIKDGKSFGTLGTLNDFALATLL
jgi:hypothetical protein